MKLSFHGEVEIYNNARSASSTVTFLQDTRICRFKKEKSRYYIDFLD